MENVVLYYNDSAGSFRMGNEKLTEILQDFNYNVIAKTSITNSMNLLPHSNCDIVIIAGGDGSVKNICLKLVKENIKDKKIAVLPFGTANNIALHFGYGPETPLEQIFRKWKQKVTTSYDIGKIIVGKEEFLFVESFGFGLFPALIRTMEKLEGASKLSPEQELKIAIKKLYKSMFDSKGAFYTIEFDGHKLEGHFLLVEIMNIKSLGPRWKIAPEAEVNDGYLDLILIPSNKKQQLIAYMKSLAQKENVSFPFKSIKAKNISVFIHEKNFIYHIDDTLLRGNNDDFQIMLDSSINFIV